MSAVLSRSSAARSGTHQHAALHQDLHPEAGSQCCGRLAGRWAGCCGVRPQRSPMRRASQPAGRRRRRCSSSSRCGSSAGWRPRSGLHSSWQHTLVRDSGRLGRRRCCCYWLDAAHTQRAAARCPRLRSATAAAAAADAAPAAASTPATPAAGSARWLVAAALHGDARGAAGGGQPRCACARHSAPRCTPACCCRFHPSRMRTAALLLVALLIHTSHSQASSSGSPPAQASAAA